MRYAVVIEPAGKLYSAYVPDLPGCVATGPTPDDAELQIRDAIESHIDVLRQGGVPVPQPTSRVEYINIAS